jgi:hypothetical protein
LVLIAFCPFSVSDHPCASLAALTDQDGDDASFHIRLGLHFGFSSTVRYPRLLRSGTVGHFMSDPLS